MIAGRGRVRAGHAHGLNTGPVSSGRPEDSTCRTGLNNYVTGVILVVEPWDLDKWTNWNELNKWGIKARTLR